MKTKKTVKSKYLYIHNLGYLNKVHIASSSMKSKMLLQFLILINIFKL